MSCDALSFKHQYCSRKLTILKYFLGRTDYIPLYMLHRIVGRTKIVVIYSYNSLFYKWNSSFYERYEVSLLISFAEVFCFALKDVENAQGLHECVPGACSELSDLSQILFGYNSLWAYSFMRQCNIGTDGPTKENTQNDLFIASQLY